MKWTDHHVAMLQQATTNHHDLKALAAEMGCTVAALHARRCRLGMTPGTNFTTLSRKVRSKWGSKAVADKVKELIDQGLTSTDVAEQVGASTSYVYLLAKRNGLKVQRATRTDTWTPELVTRLTELSSKGLSASEAAIQLGRTVGAVNHARHLFKVETTRKTTEEKLGTEKACRICGEMKPVTEFHKWSHPDGTNGRVSQCKKCHNARGTLWRHGTKTLSTDLCAGCGAQAEVVDHVHFEGDNPRGPHGIDQVRGYLCQPCNQAVGQFYDSPVNLRAVRPYLARPSTGLFVPAGKTSIVGQVDYTDRIGAARMRNYGVTPEQVGALMVTQGGRCGICNEIMDTGREQHLDHHHETGAIRGFLCNGCNKGLGCLKDSCDVADKLADYLENPPGATVRPILDRIEGLTEAMSALLGGVASFTETALPYGLQGWQHGQDVLVILVDPLVHNQQAMESRQEFSLRRSARSLLTNLVKEKQTKFGRVVVVLPDMITPALAHSLRYTLKLEPRTVYARETEVREVPSHDAFKFLAQHHLQGGCYANIRLGLYQGDELVALMTFTSAATIRSEGGVLLQRFCTSCSVPGGASKLLAWYRARHPGTTVISFSDDGYAKGGLYPALGFTPGDEPPITYVYWFDGKLHAKSTCQQPMLLAKALEQGVQGLSQRPTETELANRLGYARVFLPGRRKWTLT